MGDQVQLVEALFEDTRDGSRDMWGLKQRGVLCYRTKIIRAGDQLECIGYPIVTREYAGRAQRRKPTPAAMKRVNEREMKRRLVRKAEANFSRQSLFLTLTYGQDPGEEQAHRDLSNYLRRLKYASHGKLKYIAVTEIGHNGRVHHHILMDGVSRDLAESKWQGGYVNARRYQHTRGGFTGLIQYMTKKNSTLDPGEEGIGKKRVRCSTGLKEPEVKISDHRISRRRMEMIAQETAASSAMTLEKVFKGYTIVEPPVITSSWYLPGAFLYAKLRKKE